MAIYSVPVSASLQLHKIMQQVSHYERKYFVTRAYRKRLPATETRAKPKTVH